MHALVFCLDHWSCELRKNDSSLFAPFLRTSQQPILIWCNRSTTNLLSQQNANLLLFISVLVDLFVADYDKVLRMIGCLLLTRTIDPPSSDTMLALVAEQIGKMNGRASPGFDCVAASFIKNAVVVRPKPDGRGSERFNVLAPYIAQLFNLLYDKACTPTCWKQAKLSPLYKKGPLSDPNNYRMLAVSGTMYHMYANVVRSLLTEWCVATCQILTPNMFFTQVVTLCNTFSFFGTYNMLHEQLDPMGRLGCTLLSLISNKPMTPFQGMHYGNTFGVLACLRLCCL